MLTLNVHDLNDVGTILTIARMHTQFLHNNVYTNIAG
jgi:hypothetical protein